MDVNEASDLCRSMGAWRVVIDSEEKQNLIEDLFRSNNYWLALEDQREDTNTPKVHVWSRSDGSSHRLNKDAFSNWLKNEGGEFHQKFVMNTCIGGKCGWADVYSDGKAEVICQKSKAGK